MIQRIQSIYLLLAAAAGFGLLALPFATTPENVETSALFADAAYNVNDNIGLLVLFAVAGALALAAIFMFNNRKTQMKLAQVAIVANVVGLILAFILILQDGANLGAVDPDDGIGAYLPFGFLLFGILALRAIGKDEKLVKSMDRLR
ncbi:MAG: DUF4293 domain-containing protein [Bacteroidota bacterium]